MQLKTCVDPFISNETMIHLISYDRYVDLIEKLAS